MTNEHQALVGSGISGIGSSCDRIAAFVASREWQVASAVIKATVRRLVRLSDQEDAAAEARLRLLTHIASGGAVEHLAAFVAQVARSAGRWLRKQGHGLIGSAEDDLPVRPERASFDDLTGEVEGSLGLLRGATQRRIACGILAGLPVHEIAAQMGQPAKEIRRKVLRLARKLQRDRKPTSNCHL